MIAAVAPGAVNPLGVRGRIAVGAPSDLTAGALERGNARRTSEALGSGRGHEAVELRDASRIEGISSFVEELGSTPQYDASIGEWCGMSAVEVLT
jgi:hypothetical protein